MRPSILISSLWIFLLSMFFMFPLSTGEAKTLGFSIPFPEVTFTQTLSKGEQAYLGIPQRKSFSLKEIRGHLVLIGFFSAYCQSCGRQTSVFNELYSSIEKDPGLKGKVKIIGVAPGNNPIEVETYKKEYKIPYPLISDLKFDVHTAAGSPRIPFTIWTRKDAQGKGIVVSTHLGSMDLKNLMDETKAVLQYDLTLLKPKKGAIYGGDTLTPPLSEEELMAKTKEGMESVGGKVLQIKKIALKDGDWVYLGKVDFGTYQKILFSKLASRRAVCDICHDTFFIYTFDEEGKVVDLVPIHLAKMGNIIWADEDIKKLKSRTIGKSILRPFPFDPGVDSVSGATITAVLIFDSLDKAKDIYGKLKKEGYIQK